MQRRERIRTFREWLQAHPGFVPASWLHHTTGVTKSAISKAVAQGRVRAVRFTCADGHIITLINLVDGDRLDVFGKTPGGWVDDIDDIAPPNQRARRAARLGGSQSPADPSRSDKGGNVPQPPQRPSRTKTTPPRRASGAASDGPT